MKILITGANGLLGQKLTTLLDADTDTEIIATARKKLTFPVQRTTFALLDIADKVQVDKVFSKLRPDVIIHTAAMTQVDQCEIEKETCWLNNVTAVKNLVDTAEMSGTHIVHVSTDFIFDGTHGPLDESEIPKPLSYYGESKVAAEELVKASKVSWAILRTVLVYGITADMSRSNIVLWVKKSLEEGKTIQVVNDQWRTPTLAEDLAIGCRLAARKKATGIFNVSGDEMMTPYDIALRTAAFFKLDASLIRKTDSTQFKQLAVRPLRTGFIIEKAKRELGYQPHSFEEGLGVMKRQMRAITSSSSPASPNNKPGFQSA
jgi:dTDP-4-dehydrorhamnose reductase